VPKLRIDLKITVTPLSFCDFITPQLLERPDFVQAIGDETGYNAPAVIWSSLTKMPGGIFYGQLKREPCWEPLRQDPRYEKLVAELAPRD